jgi:uncharacterized membrane protein
MTAATENPPAGPPATETVLFSAELRPNRSSTARALKWLALLLAAAMTPVALGFSLLGAWPVFGFMGLELVALVALLHFNHRRSGIVERIAVTERQVHLERVNHWGRRDAWAFPKHWVRVKLLRPDTPDCRLEIRSHRHVIPLGGFLTPAERHEVWSALSRHVSAVCAPARPRPMDQSPSTSRMV